MGDFITSSYKKSYKYLNTLLVLKLCEVVRFFYGEWEIVRGD